jgi:hypothetical protein
MRWIFVFLFLLTSCASIEDKNKDIPDSQKYHFYLDRHSK